MTHGLIRIALANLSFPASPEASLEAVLKAVAAAAVKGAQIICFPECFVPGYRAPGKSVAPADPVFLERAWTAIAEVADPFGGSAWKFDWRCHCGSLCTHASRPSTGPRIMRQWRVANFECSWSYLRQCICPVLCCGTERSVVVPVGLRQILPMGLDQKACTAAKRTDCAICI
jgi:Carbon-nitrogen hydrolase